VPLLVHTAGRAGGKLGTRDTFADLGATVSEYFGLRPEVGKSFLTALR
jgi:phosphopentomutase